VDQSARARVPPEGRPPFNTGERLRQGDEQQLDDVVADKVDTPAGRGARRGVQLPVVQDI
jgi:hypothetical protein